MSELSVIVKTKLGIAHQDLSTAEYSRTEQRKAKQKSVEYISKEGSNDRE